MNKSTPFISSRYCLRLLSRHMLGSRLICLYAFGLLLLPLHGALLRLIYGRHAPPVIKIRPRILEGQWSICTWKDLSLPKTSFSVVMLSLIHDSLWALPFPYHCWVCFPLSFIRHIREDATPTSKIFFTLFCLSHCALYPSSSLLTFWNAICFASFSSANKYKVDQSGIDQAGRVRRKM